MCGTMCGTLDVSIIDLQGFRSVADFVWQLGFSSIRSGSPIFSRPAHIWAQRDL